MTKAKNLGNSRSSVSSALVNTSVSTVVITLLTFISGVLLARVLGPAVRGEYGTVLLIAQMFAGVGALSFFDAAILVGRRDRARLSERMSTLLAAAVGIGFASVVISSTALSYLPLRLSEVNTGLVILFTLMIIVTNLATQMFSAADRSEMRFGGLNFARVSAPAVFSVLTALMWTLTGENLNLTVILGLFIVSKLPSIAYWVFYYRNTFGRPIYWHFSIQAFTTGLRLHIAMTLSLLAGQLDRILGISNWPTDVLGHYFVAFSAVGAGYGALTSALSIVMFPYLAGISKSQRSVRIKQVLRLTILVSAIFVVVGFVILPMLIPLLYGQAYESSVRLALFLLVATFLQPVRAVLLEASRSLGTAMPSTLIAITSIAVLLVGYFLTEYRDPTVLIVFLGGANLASTAIGAWNLHRNADLGLDLSILPRLADFGTLRSLLRKPKGLDR